MCSLWYTELLDIDVMILLAYTEWPDIHFKQNTSDMLAKYKQCASSNKQNTNIDLRSEFYQFRTSLFQIIPFIVILIYARRF